MPPLDQEDAVPQRTLYQDKAVILGTSAWSWASARDEDPLARPLESAPAARKASYPQTLWQVDARVDARLTSAGMTHDKDVGHLTKENWINPMRPWFGGPNGAVARNRP